MHLEERAGLDEKVGLGWQEAPSLGRLAESRLSAITEEAVLDDFFATFDAAGARVLEVGGQVDAGLLRGRPVDRWLSVDPALATEGDGRFGGIRAAIEDADLDAGSFDLVFSCNAFEHVHALENALDKMRALLCPGGYLFAHFGPIWSGPDGHHLEHIPWEGRELVFWDDNFLPHWSHLLLEPAEMREMLGQRHHPGLAEKVVHQVYEDNWTNRRFYEDYLRAFLDSGFAVMSVAGQYEIDYPMVLPAGGYPDVFGHLVTVDDVIAELRRRHGPRYRNFLCRDIRVVLRKV